MVVVAVSDRAIARVFTCVGLRAIVGCDDPLGFEVPEASDRIVFM